MSWVIVRPAADPDEVPTVIGPFPTWDAAEASADGDDVVPLVAPVRERPFSLLQRLRRLR